MISLVNETGIFPFWVFVILFSGQEVGPLTLELPHDAKVGVSVKNQKVLSEKSNTCYGSQKSNMGLEASRDALWNCSLLNEVTVYPFLYGVPFSLFWPSLVH